MSDTKLCGLCDEPVDGIDYHPDCCPHEEVEVDDARDGAGGRVKVFCWGCSEEVRLSEPNEDGEQWWEVA